MPWDIVSRFVFPAPVPSYTTDSFPQELIFVPKVLELSEACPPDQCVPCLFLKYPSARFLIFYLHSNAEDIGKCYSFCSVLREQFQVHVLAVEYPGYGVCPGGPATADSVTENAFVVFRFVREVLKWPTDSIKIFGRSIGTGPAIALAVQYKVAGLILIAPLLSVKELLQDTMWILSRLVEERFPSKDRMHLIRSPVLIIHGQKDTHVPCRHGATLYELCRSRKLLVCPESMEHNTNLLQDTGYLVVPMLQFFSLPDYCFDEIVVPSWAFQRGTLLEERSPSKESIDGRVHEAVEQLRGDDIRLEEIVVPSWAFQRGTLLEDKSASTSDLGCIGSCSAPAREPAGSLRLGRSTAAAGASVPGGRPVLAAVAKPKAAGGSMPDDMLAATDIRFFSSDSDSPNRRLAAAQGSTLNMVRASGDERIAADEPTEHSCAAAEAAPRTPQVEVISSATSPNTQAPLTVECLCMTSTVAAATRL